MGFFSGKTRVETASSVWNLAGDIALRPDVKSASVLRAVLGSDDNFAQNLVMGMTQGPVKGDRRFYNYAPGYSFRMAESSVQSIPKISSLFIYPGLKAEISIPAGSWLWITNAKTDWADPTYFAEDWLRHNRPDLIGTAWRADYNSGNNTVVIKPNGESDITFAAPTDLNWVSQFRDRRLLYAVYTVGSLDPVTNLPTYTTPDLFTYQMGSGNNLLDSLDGNNTVMSDFYPIIPMRYAGGYIDEKGSYYDEAKKAYRLLTGGSIDQLLSDFKGNADVDADVDSIYLVRGVSLNTPEDIGKEYIFNFFKYLNQVQPTTSVDLTEYQQEMSQQDAAVWFYDALINNSAGYSNFGQVYNDFEVVTGPPPTTELRLKPAVECGYLQSLSWSKIEEKTYAGNYGSYFAGVGTAKVGQYDCIQGSSLLYPAYFGVDKISEEITTIWLLHQYDKRMFRALALYNLKHINRIYDTHSIEITGPEALADSEESGFLVPLHYPTWMSMSLTKRAQLATSSSYLVFNSYEEVKLKWYETGFFKFILIVVSIGLAVFTAGGSLATAGGILGSNVAVGVALGASAAAAAVVGAIANYVAAIVISQLVQWGATELFGEKVGAIIGTIAVFVAMNVGANYAATGEFSLDWGQFMKADNLLELTDAVGTAYNKWMAADTAEIIEEYQNAQEQYAEEFAEVERRTAEILGMTPGEIRPMMDISANEYFGESSEVFLNRTLLTGSDISELTFAMVHNFSDITLELPKAV